MRAARPALTPGHKRQVLAAKVALVGAAFGWVMLASLGRYQSSIGEAEAGWIGWAMVPVWLTGAAGAIMLQVLGATNRSTQRERTVMLLLVAAWVLLHFYGADLIAMLAEQGEQ